MGESGQDTVRKETPKHTREQLIKSIPSAVMVAGALGAGFAAASKRSQRAQNSHVTKAASFEAKPAPDSSAGLELVSVSAEQKAEVDIPLVNEFANI